MPAGLDLEDRLGDNLGTAVALPRGQFRQGREHVDLGQDRARLDQPRGVGRDPVAQGREQLIFQRVGAFVGVADLVLDTPSARA